MTSRSNLLVSLIIVMLVFAGVGAALFLTNQYEPPQIALVTMGPYEGEVSPDLDPIEIDYDYGIIDQTAEGLVELGGDIVVAYDWIFIDRDLTSNQRRDFLIAEAAEGYEIIIGIGEEVKSAIEGAATELTGQRFALIGAQSSLSNVASSVFSTLGAGFMTGMIAAIAACPQNTATIENNNTGNIAIMGAYESDETIQEMIYGFIQGVKYMNDTEFTSASRKVHIINEDNPAFLESYNNSELANQTAYDLYINQDVSLIFAPVRSSIVGVRWAIDAANLTLGNPNLMPDNETRRPMAINTETNLEWYGNPNPEILVGPSYIPVSLVIRTDLAVYDILNATLWGQYPGGQTLNYNFLNGGVNASSMEFSRGLYFINPFSERIPDYFRMIYNGTITLPAYPP